MLGSCTMGCRKAAQSKWLDTSAVSGAGSHWSSVHVGKQKGLSSRKPEDGSSCGSQRWIYSLSSKGEQGQMKGHSFSPEPPCSWAPTRKCLPPPPGEGLLQLIILKKVYTSRTGQTSVYYWFQISSRWQDQPSHLVFSCPVLTICHHNKYLRKHFDEAASRLMQKTCFREIHYSIGLDPSLFVFLLIL